MKLINDKNRKWWTLATVCLALFMILLDGNVVNLAIPRIMKTFSASLSQIEWINNAYLLTFAVLLITFGRLGDEVGRKKMFMSGLVAFTLGSMLCAMAKNVDQLIFFRVLQGIGGASMMPATLSLISANFEKKERGAAMGIWGAVSGLAIVMGPIIGGYLTDKGMGAGLNNFFHITDFWRYVFYINIPIGLIAFFFSLFVIKESKDTEKDHSFDFPGIILSALSVFSLTYGFIEGAKYGWWQSKEAFAIFGHTLNLGNLSVIPLLFLLSLIFGILFVLCEKHCKKDPLVDLSFFKNRNFSVGNIAGSVLNFAMMGSFFLLPLFLQGVLGFSPIKSGQVMLPLALAIMFSAPIAGKMSDKFGAKYIIIFGMIAMSLGGFMLTNLTTKTTITDLIAPFVVMGLGMGLALSPLTNITLLDISQEEIGGASGVFSTTRQIGSVMGIAILGAFLQTAITSGLTDRIGKISDIPQSSQSKIVQITSNAGYGTDNMKMQKEIKDVLMKDMGAAMPKMSATKLQSKSDTSKMKPDQIAKLKAQQLKQAEAMKLKMIEKMKNIGLGIQNAGKESFVAAVNKTFRCSAIVALFGTIIALLFRNKTAKA